MTGRRRSWARCLVYNACIHTYMRLVFPIDTVLLYSIYTSPGYRPNMLFSQSLLPIVLGGGLLASASPSAKRQTEDEDSPDLVCPPRDFQFFEAG